MNSPQTADSAGAHGLGRVPSAWIDLRHELPPDGFRLARYAFERLVEGHAPSLEEAAKAVGLSAKAASTQAALMERWGLLAQDAAGRITGALGLTVEPTPYAFRLNGRDLHTWCALDAVGIAAALGADARIRVEGLADVTLRSGRVVKAEPDTLRISLPHPRLDRQIRQEVCPEICFHQGRGTEHPDVAWLTLDEAATLGREIWKPPAHRR